MVIFLILEDFGGLMSGLINGKRRRPDLQANNRLKTARINRPILEDGFPFPVPNL